MSNNYQTNVESFLEGTVQVLEQVREEIEESNSAWDAFSRSWSTNTTTFAYLHLAQLTVLGLILWRIW